MRITCQPPLRQWRPAFDASPDRAELIPLLVSHAAGEPPRLDRVIATGHQAWLWHPGILAKDLALTGAARRLAAAAIHVVVDQDVLDALSLALPVCRDQHLDVFRVILAEHDAKVPTGCQAPVDAGAVVRALTGARDQWGKALLADIEPVIQAYDHTPPCATLAEQTTAVLAHLMLPYTGPVLWLQASRLERLTGFRQLVDQMLNDAHQCASCYNRAVAEHPEARIAPLKVAPDRVEMPLWVLTWQQPRRRVFADVSGAKPALVAPDGRPIDAGRGERLAPKALMLTAVMRSLCCDWFIHGRGGHVYDRATEHWWSQWAQQPLAPTALASADLPLSFDVPLSDQRALSAAVWWNHHLPHNVDRALQLSGRHVEQKRQLLDHMNDDRDRPRRAAAYAQIHTINRELVDQHPQALRDAGRRLERARIGLANRAVGMKRDWCFGIYDLSQLQMLAETFNQP